MQPVMDKVEINRNLYKGLLNVDDFYEWDYSLVDPHVFPLVRNYLSRSNPTMTNIRLDPRKPSDYEKRDINQSFLNWEVGELMMTSLFYRMYFSAYLAGKGYAKEGWKHENAIKIQVKDEFGNVTEEKIMRDIVNRADAKFVRYNDILVPNRNIPMLKDQPYFIELMQQNVGEMIDENKRLIEAGEKPYWNEKWLKELEKDTEKNKLLDYQIDMVKDEVTSDGKKTMADTLALRSAVVPLIRMMTKDNEEYYIPLEKDTDIVCNNEHSNKFWHGHYDVIDFTPFPEDDEYCVMALVDVVGDLQVAATEILNQTLTNIRQINNDMWVAGTAAAQTPDWQFKRRPDGLIRVAGDATQVQNIRTQDNTMSALRTSEMVGTKIEKAGGISSLYSSGVPSQNINQTARGAQIIDNNIDTNMRMIIDLFGEQVIKTMGEHFLELNAQFVTEEQTFFITGKKKVRNFIKLDPSLVTANFDVSVNPEKLTKQTPASRQASLQNTITILQNIQTQSQGAVMVDITPVVEALIDATPDMENIDDVIVSIDEKGKRDMMMLERGQMPEMKVRDPHKDLIIYSNVWFQDHGEAYPPEIKDFFQKYLEGHMKYLQSAAQAQAMMQPAPMLPPGGGSDLGGGGGAPGMGTTEGLPNGERQLRPLVPPVQ